MRGLSRYILILVLSIFIAGTYFSIQTKPCIKPITYKIGVFDEQFNIDKDEFLKILEESGNIWENEIDKDLFKYDPEGKLTINLIYDSRQATTEENKILESFANESKDKAALVRAEYTALENDYKILTDEYTTLLKVFNAAQQKYNAEVDYYNDKGGAPKDEYARLTRDKANLEVLGKRVESKRIEVNALGNLINSKIREYNKLVDEANINIHTINKSAGKEFNEGEYVTDENGKRINIYEFSSKVELKRVLAHEFGHALGLEHVPTLESIMYYLNNSTNEVPTAEDKAELERICGINSTD